MSLVTFAAFLGGCTSLVSITSDPSGAQVQIDGTDRGKTPLQVAVTWTALQHNQITLRHPDCHDFATVLRRRPSGYILVDVLFGVYGGVLALPFNSACPVGKQHFELAPLEPRSEASASPASAAARTTSTPGEAESTEMRTAGPTEPAAH